MNCPECNGKTHVLDVRHNIESNETYRKIKCNSCGFEMFSVEFEAEADDQFLKDWRKQSRGWGTYKKKGRRRKKEGVKR